MKAMLFAAGLGTRLKPFTENHPKALALVNEKTLLERNILYLKSFGIIEIIINIHHFGNQIISFLKENNNFGCNIQISDESNEVLETGGGLLKAQNFFTDENFLVMNVDILTKLNINNFIKFHQHKNALISLAVSERESTRKLLFDKEMQLCGWKNFKTSEEIIAKPNIYKSLAFSGIHIISPDIFSLIEERGKFSIMQVYMRLMCTQAIFGYEHSETIIDVGKPESIEKAEKIFN